MKNIFKIVCLLCLVFGIGFFTAGPASADAGFVISEGILQKYTGNAEKVVIPGNVTIIGASAFDENDTVKEVVLPADLREIQNSAFQGCDNLKKVTMNKKLTKIGQMSFRNCTKLESIDIPDSVNVIGSAAFQYCSSLKTINIPQKVTMIEYGAFSGCSSLTAITVSESNEKYEAVDGVLFDKHENMLVAYPAGKKDTSYKVPDNTCVVERLAFWEVVNLTDITLPESMRTLNIRAFAHCKMISEIHLPASVFTISDFAFEECRALRSVYVMNDHASFGADIFKGVPGAELYGGIGSSAEAYAGTVRIPFHVIETKSNESQESQESHEEKKTEEDDSDDESLPEEEDNEETQSSGGDRTRWILFFGVVFAAFLIILFAILLVRKISRKEEDEENGTGMNPNMFDDWRPVNPSDDNGINEFRSHAYGSGNSGDSEGPWVLGEDGAENQSERAENGDGTQVLWYSSRADERSEQRRNREGTESFGFDERNMNYWQTDRNGMQTSRQNDSWKRSPGGQEGSDETEVFGGQAGSNETEVFGGQSGSDETEVFGGQSGSNEAEAFGGQESVNRQQRTGSAYGNEGIVRRGNPSMQNTGTAGGCTCRVCGQINKAAQGYCIRCGANLMEQFPYGSGEEQSTVFCTQCGKKNRKGDSFCTNCGMRL